MGIVHSFDLFDTLVTRVWGRPADLFVGLGAAARNLGVTVVPAREFAEARGRAEELARASSAREEVSLADIYERMPATLFSGADGRKRLMDMEVEMEVRGSRRISENVDALAAVSQTNRAIITDTYLGQSVIKRLTDQHGIVVDSQNVFVSSELEATKRAGTLFGIVRRNLMPQGWVHLGDNLVSDVVNASVSGALADYYVKGLPTRREEQVRGGGKYVDPARSLLSGAMRVVRLGRSERALALEDVAIGVVAPALIAFTLWCLHMATRRGVSDVYFGARDGQVLFRIAKEMQVAFPNLTLHYFDVSRSALRSALDDPAAAAAARAYFLSLGVGERPSAFVDVGWQASLQQALTTLLGPDRGRLAGFYFGLRRPVPLPPVGSRVAFCRSTIDLNPELIEWFMRADHGTVLGYDLSDGVARPVRDTISDDEARRVRMVQDAVVAVAKEFSSHHDIWSLDLGVACHQLRKGAMAAYHGFASAPTVREAQALLAERHSFSARHDDNTAFIAVAPRSTVLWAQVARGLKVSRDRNGRMVLWPAGSAALLSDRRGLLPLAVRALYLARKAAASALDWLPVKGI